MTDSSSNPSGRHDVIEAARETSGHVCSDSFGAVFRGWFTAPLATLACVEGRPAMWVSAVVVFALIVGVNSLIHVAVTDDTFVGRLREASATLAVLVVVIAATLWAGARGLAEVKVSWSALQIGTVIVMLPFALGSVPGLAIPATLASLAGVVLLLRVRTGVSLGRAFVLLGLAIIALILVGALTRRLFGFGA